MPSTTTPHCKVETCDEVWNNRHFCIHAANHDGDHDCLCGYSWPRTTGD